MRTTHETHAQTTSRSNYTTPRRSSTNKSEQRLTGMEQRSQTKCVIQNGDDEDTKIHTSSSHGFPTQASEEHSQKFTHHVIEKEAFRDRVLQISCTTDPASHAYGQNEIRKELREDTERDRPVKHQDDLRSDTRNATYTVTWGSHLIYIDRKQNLESLTRESGEHKRRALQVAERVFANQFQGPAGNRIMDDAQKLIRTIVRSQHS